jgi:hypothetical protein
MLRFVILWFALSIAVAVNRFFSIVPSLFLIVSVSAKWAL